MRKKIILIGLLMYSISCTSASAQVFKARANVLISTQNPISEISVKCLRDLNLKNDVTIKKKSTVIGTMTEIVQPDSWHKNASFAFTPTAYIDPNGVRYEINNEIKGTYRQKMKPDFKHSEITAGGSPDSGFLFSPSYIDNTKRIIKGESKDVWTEYTNRSTPWGKGEHIKIKPNEIIYFNFPD